MQATDNQAGLPALANARSMQGTSTARVDMGAEHAALQLDRCVPCEAETVRQELLNTGQHTSRFLTLLAAWHLLGLLR
jgi:hypothetical protein